MAFVLDRFGRRAVLGERARPNLSRQRHRRHHPMVLRERGGRPEIAGAYCAGWNKFARITSVHRQYGDYIAFNCLWRPDTARYQIPAVRTRSSCYSQPARRGCIRACRSATERSARATRPSAIGTIARRSRAESSSAYQKSRNRPIEPRPSDQGSSSCVCLSVLALAACVSLGRRPGLSHAPGRIVGGHDQSRRRKARRRRCSNAPTPRPTSS